MRAVALLSRGWYRGNRGWWRLTAAITAVVVAAALVVAGVFQGMEDASQDRVAAFFTQDVRITAAEPGAAPDRFFAPNATAQLAAAFGATPRVETTYVLSRQSLLEAYLEEEDQFVVDLPGTGGDDDFYGVGILLGLELDEVANDLLPYRVAGAFPLASDGVVEMMMSTSRFAQTLTPEERDAMEWPPTAPEIAHLRYEITAARVDPESPFKDVIRLPARVVGLYTTDLEALDAITVVVAADDARRLMGLPDGAANVLTARSEDPAALAQEARRAGLHAEGPAAFSQRYVGQLVDVVEVLGTTITALFFGFPLVLLWHGLGQAMDRSEREVAVCRAIGVPDRILGGALLLLAGRVVATGFLAALGLLVLFWWAAPTLLAAWDFPLPVAFRVPTAAAVASALLLVVAAATAWRTATRRQEVAMRLRTA